MTTFLFLFIGFHAFIGFFVVWSFVYSLIESEWYEWRERRASRKWVIEYEQERKRREAV